MDTRDKIIETAFIGFLENGYDNISLNEIVKRTGMTKGAFYYYFTNKEQLITETVEKYLHSYISLYGDSVISSDASAKDTLLAMADVFTNMFRVISRQMNVKVDARKFYSLFISALSQNKGVNQSNIITQADLKNKARMVIVKGIQNGEFKQELDIDEIVFIFTSMLHGILFDWVNDEEMELSPSLKKGVTALINLIGV